MLLPSSSMTAGEIAGLNPPGSFPLSANPALESEAVRELGAIARALSQATRAFHVSGLLLTGSLARGEAVIVRGPARQIRWLSDIECLAVVPASARADLPALRQMLLNAAACANDDPRRRAKTLKIDVNAILAPRLAAMRPAIFTHELLDHAKLLWGRPEEIAMPRRWTGGCAVLRADAFRLLNNRIMEYVAARLSFENEAAEDLPIPAYALSKFWVELGTSLSVFLDCYRSSYRERQAALDAVLAAPGCALDREIAAAVKARLDEGMAIKLGALKTQGYCTAEGLRSAAELAARVWWWETAKLLGDGAQADGWQKVPARLGRIEPTRARIRDWARLLLRGGAKNLGPSALGQAIRAGSMGTAIYAAGCLLCFFWDEIGSDGASGQQIAASLGRLFGLGAELTQSAPAVRALLADRAVKAWTRHLRSAPL